MRLAPVLLIILYATACAPQQESLPYLGIPVVIDGDTTYPTVSAFSFEDQDGNPFTLEAVRGKIYLADFIFLSCPTICPKMTYELKEVYDSFVSDTNILIVSHTIDPERDTPDRLRAYSQKMGVDTKKWRFVYGVSDSIYHIAEHCYYATAYSDSTAPGGYVHSGGILLVDRNGHIRGVYDGTDENASDQLIGHIKILLEEAKVSSFVTQ